MFITPDSVPEAKPTFCAHFPAFTDIELDLDMLSYSLVFHGYEILL